MTATILLTRDGDYVTAVEVPPFEPAAEAIRWGTRYFIRQQSGDYVEGMVWVATDDPVADPR